MKFSKGGWWLYRTVKGSYWCISNDQCIDVHTASPTQEPLSQRMSDSGVAEDAERDFLRADNSSDHPSDIGEKTLMAIPEDSQNSFSSESAPIEGDDHITKPQEGSIVVHKPSEELLRVVDSAITLEGGALETLASDMKLDMCKRSESSGYQLLMETSSLHIYEEGPLHKDASCVAVTFLLSNPLFVGTKSAHPTLSDTVQISPRLVPNHRMSENHRWFL